MDLYVKSLDTKKKTTRNTTYKNEKHSELMFIIVLFVKIECNNRWYV